MLKFKLSIVALILSAISLNAQKSINDYKYVIVPIQYEFQKSEDLYQVNSLTKFLFNKEGFTTFLSNEKLPEELSKNRCLALTAKLVNKSKMLSTTLIFDLLDCNNNVVFSSIEGKSKEKEYKKSYHECVRESFEGIKELNYTYNGSSELDVEEIIEVEVVERTKSSEVVVAPVASAAVASVVVAESVVEEVITSEKEEVVAKKEVATDVLYAQTIADGYQLVDSTPKVLYTLQNTTVADVYLIKDNTGIVYKKNGVWKVDFYKEGKLISKELNIKFF